FSYTIKNCRLLKTKQYPTRRTSDLKIEKTETELSEQTKLIAIQQEAITKITEQLSQLLSESHKQTEKIAQLQQEQSDFKTKFFSNKPHTSFFTLHSTKIGMLSLFSILILCLMQSRNINSFLSNLTLVAGQ